MRPNYKRPVIGYKAMGPIYKRIGLTWYKAIRPNCKCDIVIGSVFRIYMYWVLLQDPC